jgi:ornithine cyclodeaminase/alanine dehydrogenase-like protein (mu-crystallin family)
LIERADRIAVDSIEQARMESGDLLLARPENEWNQLKILELAEIVAGRAPGRVHSNEITVFKSNGLAVEDVICAGYVYERGLELGRGQEDRYS